MRVLLCVAILLSLPGRPLRAAVGDTLTRADIEDAIRVGKFGSPSPYRIYNPGPTPAGKPRGLVVALVYTPFIRVALAAKAAWDKGREFTLEDVTADLTQPVVYVAYRWYCCDHTHGEDLTTWDPHREPFDYQIATERDQKTPGLMMSLPSTPLSVTRDLSLLSRFGDRLPYDDLVLIATYRIGELAHAADYAIYRKESSKGLTGNSIHPGHVTPEDLTSWR